MNGEEKKKKKLAEPARLVSTWSGCSLGRSPRCTWAVLSLGRAPACDSPIPSLLLAYTLLPARSATAALPPQSVAPPLLDSPALLLPCSIPQPVAPPLLHYPDSRELRCRGAPAMDGEVEPDWDALMEEVEAFELEHPEEAAAQTAAFKARNSRRRCDDANDQQREGKSRLFLHLLHVSCPLLSGTDVDFL